MGLLGLWRYFFKMNNFIIEFNFLLDRIGRLSGLISSNWAFSINKFFQHWNLKYGQAQVIRKFFSGLNFCGAILLVLFLTLELQITKLPLEDCYPHPSSFSTSSFYSLLAFVCFDHHPCCPWGLAPRSEQASAEMVGQLPNTKFWILVQMNSLAGSLVAHCVADSQ